MRAIEPIDSFNLKWKINAVTGCWIWTAATQKDGYGILAVKRVCTLAHRFAYEYFVGPIPEGTEINHTCLVPACVNPNHLEAVTHLENIQFSVRLGRYQHGWKKFCSKGHAKDYIRPDGKGLDCRSCRREAEGRRIR